MKKPMKAQKSPSKPRGRPVEYPMPDFIPDTPENIARAVLTTPPKKASEWEHTKKRNVVE